MDAPARTESQQVSDRRRWVALIVVCLAMLMNALDGSIVNVALPSIQRDLHFSQANLTWVIDAYLITFGSFLLMAGAWVTWSGASGCSSSAWPCSPRPRHCAASPAARPC